VVADDRFGIAVAISGDTIVVGAAGDDVNGVNSGSAYLFRRNQGSADNWGLTAYISPTDAAPVDFFGQAVAIDGDTVLAGSHADDDGCPWTPNCNSGSAYVFTRNEGGADHWGQTAKITATDSITYDHFGIAVALSGDTAIIGAYADDDLGDNSGSAYVFTRNGGGAGDWSQVAKLTASNGEESDRFGAAVALDGDIAIIGTWLGDGAMGNSGLAYIFRETLYRVHLPLVMRSYQP